MIYHVYILESEKDKSYYIGYTSNLERRISEHNSGKTEYTKNHAPYKCIYSLEVDTIKEAKEKEKYVKNRGAKRYLEQLEVAGSPAA